MVSLSDNSRRSGGYFFNDEQPSIQTSDTEDLLRDHATLTEDHEIPFRKIKTVWAIVLQILLSIALVIAAFVIPVLCPDTDPKKCDISDVSLIIYIHGGLWFVLLVFDRYYRHQHNTSRLNGYLEFYRRTKNIRRLPFLIASGGKTVLLIVTPLLYEHCTDFGLCKTLKQVNYVQIVIAMETAIILPFLVIYLGRTLKFNNRRANPDVSQDEMLTSFMQSQSQSSDIGFRDENYVDQVLEKQADMIRYLKQHNSQLGKRILMLTTENSTLKTRT